MGDDWRRALTLTERRDLLRAAGLLAVPDPEDPDDLVRRHQSWASRPVHRTAEDLGGRLAVDGISLGEYALLSEGVPLPADGADRPAWLSRLEGFCERWVDLQAAMEGVGEAAHPVSAAVEPAVRPFCVALLRDLRSGLDGLRGHDPEAVLTEPGIAVQFAQAFWRRACNVAVQPVIVEVHRLGRELGLAPPDLQQAVEALRERLEGAGGPEFLAAYPVMARTLAEESLQHARNAVELCRRVRDDAGLLANAFGGGRPLGALVDVSPPLGDPHRGGRAVHALRFAAGLRVIYKPRPLAADAFVADFLQWLNARGVEATQRPVPVVDRGAYGWAEAVEPAPCDSEQEVEGFYRRQGGLAAAAYVLCAKDLHAGNIIAEGDHPVAVDLETCFQPGLPGQTAGSGTGPTALLELGLLPQRAAIAGQRGRFDRSGIGGSFDDRPGTVKRLSSPEDGLCLVEVQERLETHPNVPVLSGRPAAPSRYAAAIEAGFREVAGVVREHAGDLIGPGGLFERAAGLPVRVVARTTAFYDRVLACTRHPAVLRDALDRERVLDVLWPAGAGPALFRTLFPFERGDVLGGDVPLFWTTSDGTEVLAGDGRGTDAHAPESGLALARRRVRELDPEAIDDLAWAVRASVAATSVSGETAPQPALHGAAATGPEVPREDLRRRARELAGLVVRRAGSGPDGVAWPGVATLADGWEFRLLVPDLFNGLPGIVLFLAYAGAALGEERFAQVARDGCDALRRTWDRRLGEPAPDPATLSLGGAFGELGGATLALTHLSVLWHRPELATEALELCGLAHRHLHTVEDNDVVGGVAGTLAVAMTLHQALRDDRLVRLSARCAEMLAERAAPRGDGVAWWSQPTDYLAGFAHGAAGVSASLARLARLTGEERWWELALAGRAFEDSLYSREHRNWLDVRSGISVEPELRAQANAWCHGAQGIALARAIMFDGRDEAVARDLRVALETATRANAHRSHCLCHGSLGKLLVLRRCARLGGELGEVAAEALGRLTPSTLETIDRHGFAYPLPDGVFTPGLMLGAAGMGYALLALAEPSLPSVIGLDDLPA